MVSYDRAKFADGMDEMAIVLGANLPGEKKKLAFWNLLVQFDLIIVLAAFERCKAVLKKFPVPAEIIEQINLERQERCRLAEMNEEDKVVMWERDRQAHPEEYYTPEEIPVVMAEIRKKLGWDLDFGNRGESSGRT